VSVHSSSNFGKAAAVLDKYRVKEADAVAPTAAFTFEEGGMYQALVKQVNALFDGSSGAPKASPKAPMWFWALALIQLVAHSLAWYLWIFHRSLASAVSAAILSIAIGFSVFHTASHSGLSHDWRVNDFWTWLWGDLILGFFRPVWLVHHIWAHHSFTGVDGLDADVANGKPFVRKSPETRWKKVFRYQPITNYLLFLVLPGQWYGQVIQYMRSMWLLSQGRKARIFGIPLKPLEALISEAAMFSSAALFTAALLTYRYGPGFAFGSLAAFSAARSFMYWSIVFPNHETAECHDAPRVGDWGEQQIRHSSNFAMPWWLSQATGGMNYQIEHHLFPSVSPCHYPAISEIVKSECRKRNVPYNFHTNWFKALWSNFKAVYDLSLQGPLDLEKMSQ
jgi:linoleoyl-CoA desaturase